MPDTADADSPTGAQWPKTWRPPCVKVPQMDNEPDLVTLMQPTPSQAPAWKWLSPLIAHRKRTGGARPLRDLFVVFDRYVPGDGTDPDNAGSHRSGWV